MAGERNWRLSVSGTVKDGPDIGFIGTPTGGVGERTGFIVRPAPADYKAAVTLLSSGCAYYHDLGTNAPHLIAAVEVISASSLIIPVIAMYQGRYRSERKGALHDLFRKELTLL